MITPSLLQYPKNPNILRVWIIRFRCLEAYNPHNIRSPPTSTNWSQVLLSSSIDWKKSKSNLYYGNDAGRDTTAVTLSWFVYLLGNNPDVADKIYEELHLLEKGVNVNESLPLNEKINQYSSLLSYDVLSKLQYLHAAITETIRLYPAVPQVSQTQLCQGMYGTTLSVQEVPSNLESYCCHTLLSRSELELSWYWYLCDVFRIQKEYWLTIYFQTGQCWKKEG